MKKLKFDKEYSTQYRKEVEWLQQCGIQYNFVKEINGVSTYKYTKSSMLFHALEILYCLNKGDCNNDGKKS